MCCCPYLSRVLWAGLLGLLVTVVAGCPAPTGGTGKSTAGSTPVKPTADDGTKGPAHVPGDK